MLTCAHVCAVKAMRAICDACAQLLLPYYARMGACVLVWMCAGVPVFSASTAMRTAAPLVEN